MASITEPSSVTSIVVASSTSNQVDTTEEQVCATKPHFLFALCPDTLVHICSFLQPLDLSHMAASCHPLRSLLIVCDAVVWRQLCLQTWRDKQGFRRFCDHFDVHTSLIACDATRHVVSDSNGMATMLSPRAANNNARSTIRGGCGTQRHQRKTKGAAAPPMLSPETTLRCIRDSILPIVALKSTSPSITFSLPPSASPVSERRLWWEMSPQEQVRRLRRIMNMTPSSTSSGSSSSDEGNDRTMAAAASRPPQCDGEEDGSPISPEEMPQQAVSWKFAFFSSIRDSKRSSLTKSELVAAEWSISFSQIPGQKFAVSFREDGTLVTPLHENGLCYQLSQRGEELNVHVFPALRVHRVASVDNEETDDTHETAVGQDPIRGSSKTAWGWVIRNHFVSIESRDVPMPEYLHQLHLLCCPRPP